MNRFTEKKVGKKKKLGFIEPAHPETPAGVDPRNNTQSAL
jgi:hypothetical protein